MRLYAILIYVFLYAPIGFIVAGSFNAGKQAMIWQGFSLEWYGKAFSNPLITEALTTSLMIALATAVLSAIIGTLAALGRSIPEANGIARCVQHGAGRG